MIKETLTKIAEVTEEYATIEAVFSINSTVYGEEVNTKKVPKIRWKLYIADITSRAGNAFPEFNSFEQLNAFVNILCLELRRIKQDAVLDAVTVAIDVFKKEGEIK